MIDFKLIETKLPIVLNEMFLTLEMLHNMWLSKCQKDGMFVFASSHIEPTIIVSKQPKTKEKEEGETTTDS